MALGLWYTTEAVVVINMEEVITDIVVGTLI